MRYHRLAALVCLAALLITAPHASATQIAPEIHIRAKVPQRALSDGEAFAIPVDIYVREDVILAGIGFVADLRSAALVLEEEVVGKSAPGRYRMERRVLRGTLEPGLDRIRIQVEANGEIWEDVVHLRRFGDPLAQVEVAADVDVSSGLEFGGMVRPQPIPSGHPRPEPVLGKAPRTVRVHGRIAMQVEDQGEDRGVDGATVYFMRVIEFLDDYELGSTTTAPDGTFDFDVTMDGVHDVYIKVRALNSAVNVGTDAGFQTYGRNLPTVRDFAGTSFDAGPVRFSDDMNHALWILTTQTRAWRWYAGYGVNLPQVNTRFPDDILQSSCYLQIEGMWGIHLRSTARWDTDTVLHEYGHHMVGSTVIQEVSPPFYTNGVCDPGHCRWCQENEAVAWSEGLPYFMASMIDADHAGLYGWAQNRVRSYEQHEDCGETDALDVNKPSTEGFLSALLHDIVDARQDGSSFTGELRETAQFPIEDIFTVALTSRASDSLAFLTAFREYVAAHPEYGDEELRDLWSAAAVNGYEDDTVPPMPPALIQSSTHLPGVPSTSNLPVLSFYGATDDNSGVDRFVVTITPSASYPSADSVVVVEPIVFWPSVLPEGSYWANVVAVDRAGNWSATQTSYGPLLVGPPSAADFEPVAEYLWESPLVFRHDTAVTATTAAQEPVLLASTDLWMSFFGRSTGLSAVEVPLFASGIWIAGQNRASVGFGDGIVSPQQDLQILNHGPIQLRGGSYHVSARLDPYHAVAEGNETNNRFEGRIVVRPEILPPGPWVAMPAGPMDISAIAPAVQTIPNMQGSRIVPENAFAAVQLDIGGYRNDYFMRLYPASTGWNDGFDDHYLYAPSGSGSRKPTFVLNAAQLPGAAFDVGVQRVADFENEGYSIRHISSQGLAPGASTAANWAATDHLALYELTFDVLQLGPFSVELEAQFGTGEEQPELQLIWVQRNSTGVVLTSAVGIAARTGEDGRAQFETNVTTPGTYGLVVYRDSLPGMTHAPVAFSLSTTTVPQPELEIIRENADWRMPFLPSLVPVAGPTLDLPTDLRGGGSPTYLNFVLRNQALTASPAVEVAFEMNGAGQAFSQVVLNPLAGNSEQEVYGSVPHYFPAGRNTLTIQVDPRNLVAERDETNNVFSTQFGWRANDFVIGSTSVHPAPPDPEAGHQTIQLFQGPPPIPGDATPDVALNFIAPNSAGHRMPPYEYFNAKRVGGRWVGVATMPGASSDVDLRLHQSMPPAQAFTTAHASSQWGTGASDFVLVDHSFTPIRWFDIGVVKAGGFEPYTLHSTGSLPLGTAVDNAFHGPFMMDAGQILALYEVSMQPGTYEIEVLSQSFVDLGISVFAPITALELPYHSKSDIGDGVPSAWENPAGASETVSFVVDDRPEGSNYCIVVWKAGAADLPLQAHFSLHFTVALEAPAAVEIDGVADQAYGPPLFVQGNQTQFGDNTMPHADLANGSELDQVFGVVRDDILYLLLAGNLESNFNDLELFFDTHAGGQNRLRGDNHAFVDDGLNRMGDDGRGNGLTFDAGFAPDYWLSVQGGDYRLDPGSGIQYKLAAYFAELTSTGGGVGRFLGATRASSSGYLGGHGADNPDGIRVTVDNSNSEGVDSGVGASSGAGVLTGVEVAIPLTAIGNPTGCIRMTAFINGRAHDFVSNQVAGGLPIGTGNLGEPRDVDFSAVAGDQYVHVCPDGVVSVDDTAPEVLRGGVTLHPPTPNPFNPRTRLRFTLPQTQSVRLELYDLAGRRVRTLLGGETVPAGTHESVWTGTDDRGRAVASGTYVVKLSAGSESRVERVTLVR